MPTVLPNELKKATWEALKKTLPAPYNKDATVTPTLDALQTANNAVNWTILEQAVDNANKALDSNDREKIVTAAEVQLKKLDPLAKAATTAKTAIGKIKANVKGEPAFAKMFEAADSFEKFVIGFNAQTSTQLKNSKSQASNRSAELTLDKVLANAALKEKFVAFLATEHSSENIEFLEAVKAGPSKVVYEKYVKSGVVNLPAPIVGKLKACYEPPIPTPAIWKEAYDDIVKLLSNDTLQRFKKKL